MKRNIYFSTPLAVSAVSTGKFEQWNQKYKETCFFKSLKEMCGIDIPGIKGVKQEQHLANGRPYKETIYSKKRRGHVDEIHYRVAQLNKIDFRW